MPCLLSHITPNISFTLVVDDFGVKYNHDTDLDALVSVLEKKYKVSIARVAPLGFFRLLECSLSTFIGRSFDENIFCHLLGGHCLTFLRIFRTNIR